MVVAVLGFFDTVVNASVGDTVAGWGPEIGTAGLSASTASGGITLGVDCRDYNNAGVPTTLAFAAASNAALPAPGVPVLGAQLMLVPTVHTVHDSAPASASAALLGASSRAPRSRGCSGGPDRQPEPPGGA